MKVEEPVSSMQSSSHHKPSIHLTRIVNFKKILDFGYSTKDSFVGSNRMLPYSIHWGKRSTIDE